MNIATIILVFTIVWWLIFFAALPIGVRSQNESDDGVTMGTVPSAPVNPYLGKKALWTTIIALALTVGYYFLATSGLVDIDPTN